MDSQKENEFIFNEIDELKHFVNLRAKKANEDVEHYILDMYDRDPGSLDGAFQVPYHALSAQGKQDRRGVLEKALQDR